MILDLCIDDFYQCKESIKVYKGISPTLLSERNGLKVIEMNEVRILGQMDNSINHTFESANRVYDKLGLCPTIPTCAGGNIQPKIIDESIRIRQATKKRLYRNGEWRCSRGRVQGGGNISPTLTTGCDAVHKIDKIGNVSTKNSQAGSVFNPDGYAMGNIAIKYRIRKLTPKECWRLMNFSDSDFEKASKVNSNTQLYKEAGNSIVVSCLTAIFSQLNIQGIKPWNERNDDEKKQLING